MKEITKYLDSKEIEATLKFSTEDDYASICFKLYDKVMAIRVTNNTTIKEFIVDTNIQYLNSLNHEYKMYTSYANGLSKQIENYTGILK